jgi:glycosyltransferase involved in cell wall biosynthesis
MPDLALRRDAHAFSLAVVIPVHNKAAYVGRAIASALDQNAAPTEVIVIDDASCDESAERIKQFEKYVRILRRDTPGPGGYAARNLAVESTQCDWIAFLDADDWWRHDHLHQIRRSLDASDEPAVGAFTRYDEEYENSRLKSRPAPRALMAHANHAIAFEDFVSLWLAMRDCPILTTASVFRRDALISAGLFPAGKTSRGGDKDLWLRMLALGPAVFVPRASAVFNRASTNKVTHRVGTATIPYVCSSIARMLDDPRWANVHPKLRALANQEIELYARQHFARGHIPASMRRAVLLPNGWRTWLTLLGMQAAPLPLARSIRAALRPTSKPALADPAP